MFCTKFIKWTWKSHSRVAKSLQHSTSVIHQQCMAAGTDPSENISKAVYFSVLCSSRSIPVANMQSLCKKLKIADCHLKSIQVRKPDKYEKPEQLTQLHREIQRRDKRGAHVSGWIQKEQYNESKNCKSLAHLQSDYRSRCYFENTK